MRGIRTLTVRLLEFYGLVELPFSLEKTTYAYDYLPDRRRRVESFWSFLLLKVALGILMQRELHAHPRGRPHLPEQAKAVHLIGWQVYQGPTWMVLPISKGKKDTIHALQWMSGEEDLRRRHF